MAFHQPTSRQPYHRAVRSEDPENGEEEAALAPQIRSGPDESQTWVLFSPATDAGTTTSYLSSVADSQPTPGRSQLSSSLNTVARSDLNSQPRNSAVAPESSTAEEDLELDSLDSHLPGFRSAHNPYGGQQHATPVLPAHDGLGSFALGRDSGTAEMQEQLYAFERFNPRRVVKRRRESLDLGLNGDDQHDNVPEERNQRIEAWRLEQSRLLLEEIHKETQRQRSRTATERMLRPERSITRAEEVGQSFVLDEAATHDWHEQDDSSASDTHDGFWRRVTRSVMLELLGIDDKLLAILFGEALPENELTSTHEAAVLPAPFGGESLTEDDSSTTTWQLHVLERVARELGHLVHRMSGRHHPGAFSTYARMTQMPIAYAGLPAIPEATASAAADGSEQYHRDAVPTLESSDSAAAFRPTVAAHPQLATSRAAQSSDIRMDSPGSGAGFTQQEWEQDLDIKLVFRYLRSRFTSSTSPASTPAAAFASAPLAGTSHLATSSTQDAAAKAARVRQHHPLVSSSATAAHHARERRALRAGATSPAAAAALRHHHHHLHHHYAGSCASHSTRRRSSAGSSRHSSRHYWDVGGGGSLGTGSAIASGGPMGSWSEV